MQFLPFCCGAFGEKETLEASVIKIERAQIYGLVFLKPYLSRSLLPPFFMSLAMHTYVLFFILDLLGVSLVNFMCI
jgi:hypothetical protein